MKKGIILALTSLVLSASINISLAAEPSRAEAYVNQLLDLNDPDKTAKTIQDVQGKLAACQQLELADCNYYVEILSLLSPAEAQ